MHALNLYMHGMHACIVCMHVMHAYVCMYMYACILCMHMYACILCMHSMHACILYMHTMHACYAYMHTMHTYYACICMHTQYLSIQIQFNDQNAANPRWMTDPAKYKLNFNVIKIRFKWNEKNIYVRIVCGDISVVQKLCDKRLNIIPI